jgi:transcription elongation factor Elf1
MGNNVNLCDMLGLPKKITCPHCNNEIDSLYDDFDIECGHPNPSPGAWSFQQYCPICEHEWVVDFAVEMKGKK